MKEGSWMEKWSQQGKRETNQVNQKEQKKPPIKTVTVPTDTVMHLYQLYGADYASSLASMNKDEPEQSTLPKENDSEKKDIKKITADLADIEFDDF